MSVEAVKSLLSLKSQVRALRPSDNVDDGNDKSQAMPCTKPTWTTRSVVMVDDKALADPLSSLHPDCAEGLAKLGISSLFTVQKYLFPAVVTRFTTTLIAEHSPLNCDLCVSCPTGQGKTLAYALPLAHCLASRKIR
jgi:superfamily II DNA/RNA helicase